MAPTRVQIASHFTIDPAKQIIGHIEFPETITVTIVVGEDIDAKKVPFDQAFTPEQKTVFEKKLGELVKEALRTAQPVKTSEPSGADQGGDLAETNAEPEEAQSAFEVL